MSKAATTETLEVFTFESPLGPIYGAVSTAGLMALTVPIKGLHHFAEKMDRLAPGADSTPVEPGQTKAGRQLADFFAGQRPNLSAPLDLRGVTDFTRDVLMAVYKIPLGQVRTYGQIAKDIGRPQAARAVGRAVGSNPIPIFIA